MKGCPLHIINPPPAFCARCQRCTDEGFMKSLPYNTKAAQFAKQPKPVVPKPRSVKAVKKMTAAERKPQGEPVLREVQCQTPGCTATVLRGTNGRQRLYCPACALERKRASSRYSERKKAALRRGGATTTQEVNVGSSKKGGEKGPGKEEGSKEEVKQSLCLGKKRGTVLDVTP